jgi:hypothetical protein
MTSSLHEPLPLAVLDVVLRDHAVPVPPVRQCRQHESVALVERPIDCPMCSYDVRAALQHALVTNEWLDRWRTDMLTALETK